MNRVALATLAAWLALVSASVAIVARSGLSTDLQAFLPGAPTPAQQVLVDQLRDGLVSRLILVAIAGDEPGVLADLSKDLARRLAEAPEFAAVNNGSDDEWQAHRDFLVEHRYLLSSEVVDGHFSADNLRRALHRQLRLLSSSIGALTAPLVSNDPTGEFLSIIEKLETKKRPDMRHGVWFDAAGTRALLVAQTVSPGFDIDAQQAAVERIVSAFHDAQAAAGETLAELIVVGPGVFATQIRDAIKADAIRVTSAAALTIAALLLFVMRSLRALALILVPVSSGALVGIAAVALAFGQVHGITIGFGATLIGESVDYAIHLLAGSSRGQRPQETIARIWPTLRLGVMTSVVGTAALLFSGFPGLVQLAVFSICGLAVALVVTRWVVPLLMPRDFSVRGTQRWEQLLRRIVHGLPKARIPLLIVVLVCAAWLLIKGGALWNDDFESLSPVSDAAKALDRNIRAELGAPDVRQLIVVRGVDQEATLQIAEAVGRALDALSDHGVLAGYESPALYLPSKATQRARQEAIPQQEQLRANLSKAASGLPFKAGVFEEFIVQVQSAKKAQPLERRDLESTPLAARVDTLLVRQRGAWHAMLPLLDVTQPDTLAAALTGFDPQQVMLLDLKAETDALYSGYRVQILTFAVIGAVAIVMLLLAALRSVRRCMAVVAPVMAAVVVSVAVLVAIGIELNMFHLVAMLLVIGVGTNYTLFFDRALRYQHQRGRIYVSLATCNLSTVLGFGVIALASTPVLSAIGMTVAIGAALSLLFGAAWMHPADEASVAGSQPVPDEHR
ncbi:MAG: MMPL family transporter [Betaproteobacteria bacterium]|nr:MAG: MMPL family transporter [Betaproteobacteria bacterium]